MKEDLQIRLGHLSILGIRRGGATKEIIKTAIKKSEEEGQDVDQIISDTYKEIKKT